jgi:hypothetical protein
MEESADLLWTHPSPRAIFSSPSTSKGLAPMLAHLRAFTPTGTSEVRYPPLSPTHPARRLGLRVLMWRARPRPPARGGGSP